MKKISCIILFTLCVIGSNAQAKKNVVVMVRSQYHKEHIRSYFETGLQSTYNILDRNNLGESLKEIESSLSLFTVKDSTVQNIGKKYNAQIFCYVQCDPVSKDDNDELYIFVRLVEVETDMVIHAIPRKSCKNKDYEVADLCKRLIKELLWDVDRESLNFDYTGEKNVFGNTENGVIQCYKPFEIPTMPAWVSVTKETDKITVQCHPNKTIRDRVGTIKLLFEKQREVTISINQRRPKEFIDRTKIEFDKNGGDKRINLSVEDKFKCEISPEEVKNRLSVNTQNRGFFTVHSNENRGYKEFYATITLIFPDSSREVIEVKQEKGDFFELHDVSITTGNTYTVKIYNNINAKIEWAKTDRPDWIEDVKIDYKNSKVEIICKKNKVGKRECDVHFDIDGSIQESIHLTQEPIIKESYLQLKTTTKAKGDGNVATDGGLSLGYALQGWNLCIDRNIELSQWEQPQQLGGFMGGFRLNHFFTPDKFPWGIDWGIYYNYVSAKNRTAINPIDVEYNYNIQKHVVYVPFHLIWKFDFHYTIGLLVYGGVGMDFGIKEKISMVYMGETEPFYSCDEKIFASTLERFNLSYEYGIGLQFPHCMLSVGMSNRFFSSAQEVFTKKQKQGLIVSLAIMFGKPAGKISK